eukprot:TRINITY_DN16150_c0_g1_i1.p1 TRINITY_DN16150_c0_g1~~TRINITY_DN16150_c0_g1_i1.p1  ORF type:complete len:313 (+),score=72.88 TRINITY_DN16150_c0_g1_i1:130-1068(+)
MRKTRRRKWGVCEMERPGQPEVVPESREGAVGADYEVVRKLGEGSQGKCMLVRCKADGTLAARKELAATDGEDKRLMTEIEILKKLGSKYLVSFLNSYSIGSEVHLLLEYMDAGDLGQWVERKVPYDIIKIMARQILEGVQCLHAHNYLHRDLKPENVLLSSTGYCKISDFGVAKVIPDCTTLMSRVGSFAYMSPERLLPMSTVYHTPADIWSVGMLVLTLLCARFPVTFKTHFQLIKVLSTFSPTTPTDNYTPPDSADPPCMHFIASCLSIEASDRPTARDALALQYFADSNTDTEAATLRQYITVQEEGL